MTRVRSIVFALLLVMMLSTGSLAEQHNDINPEAAGKVAELFPNATGSFSLREKMSARLATLGVKLINYDVMLDEKKAGEVTRIISLSREGLAANLDMLVRYDEKSGVQGIVSLKLWKEGEVQDDMTRLLWSLRGQDLQKNNTALISLITGLSAGTALTDGLAPPSPEGGYPLNVKQLLLEPGAQLPSLKIKGLAGKSFDTSSNNKTKLLISFLSPDNPRSSEMAQAIEKTALRAIRDKKVSVIHIITAPVETAVEYAKTFGLTNVVAADPAGLLSRMFQVPYSPYLFMFNKGILTAPVTWEGEQSLQNAFSQFLNDSVSTVKGASK